jgi:hypothetical protein
MDYKPTDYFSVMLSPLTGKITFVVDKYFEGMFGLEKGEMFRAEIGSCLKSNFNRTIVKNVNLSNEIGLFSNYLNKPQNIDVDWKVSINMRINNFLSTSINTQLLYDSDIIDPVDNKAKIQFKELLGLGLNFKF